MSTIRKVGRRPKGNQYERPKRQQFGLFSSKENQRKGKQILKALEVAQKIANYKASKEASDGKL